MDIVCPNDAKYADEIAALLKPPSPQQVQECAASCVTTSMSCIQEYFDKLVLQRRYSGLRVKQSQEFGKELQIGRKLCLQDIGVSFSGVCHMLNGLLSKGHCQTGASDEEDSFDAKWRSYGNSNNCAPSSSNDKIPLPKEVVKSLMNGDLVLPHSQHFPLPSAVSCPGGCEEAYYCSESCAESDWGKGHSLLCTGQKSKAFCREALAKFIEHADETNDIFILAAKAISFTVKRYRNFKEACVNKRSKYSTSSEVSALSLLLEAWKPISMGYKARWWDCIALPEDVDLCDEASFRMEIKELAYTSLLLLKDAMFNLDLVVESPVENYFLFVDDLPIPEKEDAEKITRPILDALGEDYSVCCEGTAFFPLQSCMNHSCRPNAKAFKREEDKDGQATIIALRDIRKGEEITISYIDEDLPYEDRQSLLADYGFRCRCAKCCEEAL